VLKANFKGIVLESKIRRNQSCSYGPPKIEAHRATKTILIIP
jgi:hypothetical protein